MKIQNAKEIKQLIASHPLEQRRIFSIIAHIDHGKSTVADYLLKRAGLISRQRSQQLGPAISMTEEEKERSITMYTSVVTLAFELKDMEYLIQFNDTPGHISFTGEVSRALRSSDGVVIVIDALEGIMPQTITNMELAIRDELCKPVLFINKVDRLINELQLSPEKVGRRLAKIVQMVNNNIIKYVTSLGIELEWEVKYDLNSVAIGSAKDGWAFTSQILVENNLSIDEVFQRYEANQKEWLQERLPLDEALLRMIIDHCPNPKEAQKVKIPQIWNGDISSTLGQALLQCDAKGPAMGMVTKVIIDDFTNMIILVGRLFSGTLHTSDVIFLHSKNEPATIKRLGIMEITDILNVDVIPAGTLFAMTGPICQAGETIDVGSADLIPFENISYVAEPVVSTAIAPQKIGDQIKLHDLVRKWLLVDPTLSISNDENDNRIVLHGVDPLQIEVLVSKLNVKVPLKISEPSIMHRETILDNSGEITIKSNNGHNRVTVTMVTLQTDVIQYLKSAPINSSMTRKEIASKLSKVTSEYDEKFFRGYWAHQDANLLVDATKGVLRLERIKEFTIQAWREFIQRGTLSGEPLYGTMMVITDAHIHVDASHSGISEVISMIHAGCNLSFLNASPRILEPLMSVEIKAPIEFIGKLENMLVSRRGKIIDLTIHENSAVLSSTVPATEFDGFADMVRNITSGTALFGYEFHSFQIVPSHLESARIKLIRERNDLPPQIPDRSAWKKLIYN